jgi:hypothetical protein
MNKPQKNNEINEQSSKKNNEINKQTAKKQRKKEISCEKSQEIN